MISAMTHYVQILNDISSLLIYSRCKHSDISLLPSRLQMILFSLPTTSPLQYVRYFSRGRVKPGVAHDQTQFSKIVPKGAKADAIYRRYIVKFARINGIMKEQYFSTRFREKDVWRRNRLLGESAYFKKWSYIKYCCQLIKYSVKNNLTLGLPFEPTDEMRHVVKEGVLAKPLAKIDGYTEEELLEMQKRFNR